MAIVDIHITEQKIIDCIIMNTDIDKTAAIRYFHKEKVLGFYASITKSICIYMDRVMRLTQKKTLEEKLAYIITHEEIHHWLHENFDLHVSNMFDNIAFSFMKEM